DHRSDLAAGTAAEADASRRSVLPVPADRRNGLVTRATARVFSRHPASSADLILFILDIVDNGHLDAVCLRARAPVIRAPARRAGGVTRPRAGRPTRGRG